MPTIYDGYAITKAHLDAWTPLLVSDIAPFFMSTSLAERMAAETLLITRDEYNRADVLLSYRDSYKDYRVHADGMWVAMLDASAFDALLPALRTELLLAQAQLRRGQVYDLDTIRPLLDDSIEKPLVQSRIVDTPDGMKLVLDAAIWQSLQPDVQHRWLTQFVLDEQESYVIVNGDAVAWDDIEPRRRANVEALANRFPLRSGPNCFATALAAITLDREHAHIIGETWLHQGPFLRSLNARGYEQSTDSRERMQLQDAVLVWYDQARTAQHACYVLDGRVALNKNSQQWYTPTHLVVLSDLIGLWSDDPFDIAVYKRQG